MDVTRLDGKLVLITGAGSGIGRATALACGRRGAALALCDINEAGLAATVETLRGMGCTVLSRRVDVARDEDMRAFADAVHAEFPAVDLLVNNAGVGLGGGFLDTSMQDWDWILGINLRGVILGCHYFLPKMVERGRGGHVVNVSSMAALAPSSILSAYATTKCAVLGLSEALVDELEPYGIGVTAICPGVIDTPIVEATVMRGPNATDEVREQMKDMYRKRGYSAERVADNLLVAVGRGRVTAPISPESWFAYILRRLSPALLHQFRKRMGARLPNRR